MIADPVRVRSPISVSDKRKKRLSMTRGFKVSSPLGRLYGIEKNAIQEK